MTLCPWCHDSPDAPIARRWELRIEMPWPNNQARGAGANRLSNAGAARFAYKKLRTDWEQAVALLVIFHDVTPATSVRRLTLAREWGKRQRALDPDNMVAGGKPVVDACVKAGLITGDRRDQARIHYDQRKSADGVARVVITVEEFA